VSFGSQQQQPAAKKESEINTLFSFNELFIGNDLLLVVISSCLSEYTEEKKYEL
jgi:hypothetical protein